MSSKRSKFRPRLEVLENRQCLAGLGVIAPCHVTDPPMENEATDPAAIIASTDGQIDEASTAPYPQVPLGWRKVSLE